MQSACRTRVNREGYQCGKGRPRLQEARSDGRAIGYVIRTSEITVYYTGDTDYFPGLTAIGKRFHPEVTLLNLNAHLHSEEALAAIAALGRVFLLPIWSES